MATIAQSLKDTTEMHDLIAYIETLADYGIAEACHRHPALVGGINVWGGKVTHKAVAEAHGLPCEVPKL